MKRIGVEARPQDILLLHVGGGGWGEDLGSYGPIDAVLRCFPRQSLVVAFEARENEEDKVTQSRYEANGVRTVLVNACIGEVNGTSPFFINTYDHSSSMLAPSQQALDEHIVGNCPPGVITWRQNTELDRVTTLNTISLHEFIEEQGIVPDVISIDAQGMELGIMKGAASAMQHVNCVVSEVEFFEIYSGQGLFHEQMRLLEGYGIRLADLLNTQYWHPGPASGEGFLTVAEALWLRKIDAFLASGPEQTHFVLRGIKLSALAFAFKRYSYAYVLLKALMERDKALVVELCDEHGFESLLAMTNEMDNNLGNYALDNSFFAKHPPDVRTRRGGVSPSRSVREALADAVRRVWRVMFRYIDGR